MPRAQKACEHLRELNPDVNGNFIVERNLAQRLQSSPGFLDDFSVVVACNVASSLLLPLADVLWQKKVGDQMELAGRPQPLLGGGSTHHRPPPVVSPHLTLAHRHRSPLCTLKPMA